METFFLYNVGMSNLRTALAPVTACLACIAITAAVMAPASTSDTGELDRILNLQERVNSMQADIEDLQGFAAQTTKHAACYTSGVPVTSYKGADGKRYLAATRKPNQKRLFVALVSAGCMPKHLRANQLGWHW